MTFSVDRTADVGLKKASEWGFGYASPLRYCLVQRLAIIGFGVVLVTGHFGCQSEDQQDTSSVDIGNEPITSDDPAAGSEIPAEDDVTESLSVTGSGRVEHAVVAGPLIRLTAVADLGWQFVSWSGTTTSTANPLTLLVSTDTKVTANFELVEPADDSDGHGETEIADEDADGVADALDRCSRTEPEAQVDVDGCSARQRDSDADGVSDADDLCPRTPLDSAANSRGCGPEQRDSDGDNIVDADDLCPSTLPGSIVQTNGCTDVENAGNADLDGDGVPNGTDSCPSTSLGIPVDAIGCPLQATPACGNQIIETGEQCEPPNTTTCDAMCRHRTMTPLCGNGIVETGEACDAPGAATCSADCRIVASPMCGNLIIEASAGETCDPPAANFCSPTCQSITPANPVCGNGLQESGEGCDTTDRTVCGCDCQSNVPDAVRCGNCVLEAGESCDPPSLTCGSNCRLFDSGLGCGNSVLNLGEDCEPPNTDACDANCRFRVRGPVNDRCEQSRPIAAGRTSFLTVQATLDGPPSGSNNCSFGTDIWYCYRPAFSGPVTVSICDATFPAVLAVYEGCNCGQPELLDCMGQGLSGARCLDIQIPVTAGQSYLVRVGGPANRPGSGAIEIVERPPNDLCEHAIASSGLLVDFTNFHALTDGGGIMNHADCQEGTLQKDVWIRTQSPCSGDVTFSLCGSSFDTVLAVYQSWTCPATQLAACNDDGCGAEGASRITLRGVIVHQEFLLRIGGFLGVEGTGRLNVSCVQGDTCGPGNGDCFSAHANPGCEDDECCAMVARIPGASSCVDQAWDEDCALLACFFCDRAQPCQP